jgi:hypothetical protein
MVRRLDFQRCKWLWVVSKRVRVFFYLFLSITIPNVNVDFAAQPWSKGRLAFFSIGLGLAFTSSAFLAFGPEKIVG